MSYITLDFETAYRSRVNIGTPGDKYSLRTLTYEEYIFDPKFKIHGVGIKIDEGKTRYIKGFKKAINACEELFHENNHNTLIAHNAMFDGAILNWKLGLHIHKAICTLQMSRALWFQAKHSLEALVKRLFPFDPSMRKGNELETVDGLWELTTYQKQKLGEYCKKDVDLTFAAFSTMFPYFPDQELDVLAETLDWFIKPSFVVDQTRVENYEKRLREEQLAKLASAFDTFNITKNTLSSNKQFHEWLENRKVHVPIIPSPTKLNPSNTKPALGKNDPEFLDMIEANKELAPVWDARLSVQSKGELTRCKQLLIHSAHQKENKIAVPLNYWGAGTGRWAGTNKINFHNFKKKSEIRKSLKAPQNHKVVVSDLSNIEGRINAWNAGEQWVVNAFAKGNDLYNELGGSIYGRPIDRHTPEDEISGFVSKVAFLGLGYGMGAVKFQSTLKQGIMGGPRLFYDMRFCKNVVDTYREKNSSIVQYWKLCKEFLIDMCNPNLTPYYSGVLKIEYLRIGLPNGLYLNYPALECLQDEDTGQTTFQYWNGKFMKYIYGAALTENIVQALSRIVMAEMIIDIRDWIKPKGGRVASSVHDEIILIAPDSIATETLEKLNEIMSKTPAWAKGLPLSAKGDIADSYGDCK